MTNRVEFKPDENGLISASENDHYALYVKDRLEEAYPDGPITRYEIVNKSTLAVEARVSSLSMAIVLMREFDRRVEELCSGVLPEDIDADEGSDVSGLH